MEMYCGYLPEGKHIRAGAIKLNTIQYGIAEADSVFTIIRQGYSYEDES